MIVAEVMTPNVQTCSPTDPLHAAAQIMWERDCGSVPVVREDGHVVGMITDRDICIAAATKSRAEGDIQVREVLTKPLRSCSPTDDVRAAMETMRTQQLRRLPVVEPDGRLAGIVSLHDIAIQARGRQAAGISPNDVVEALIAITAQPPMGASAVA